MKGNIRFYTYIYIYTYIHNIIYITLTTPLFFVGFACKPRVYLLWWSEPWVSIWKPGAFRQNRVRPAGDAVQAANIPTSLEFPGFVTSFLIVLSFLTRKKRGQNWCRPQTHDWPVIDPWQPMIFLQKPLGLDPETRGFGVSPMFIPSPVTKPWWTRDLPVTREIKVACGCWSCQTLGFVWKPWVSQMTLRISRVLLVRCISIYIIEMRWFDRWW